MGVGELIEQIRSLYVTSLQDALAARRAACSAVVAAADAAADSDGVDALIVEPIVTDAAGTVIRHGALTLPRRHDGVAADAAGVAQPFVVDSEGLLGFEDISFDWGDDLNVRLTPFSWDFAEFEVETAGSKDLTGNLGDWFERWFTPPNAPAGELTGALHALSDVHEEGALSRFQVDFGSAPLACFEDLLDALGASRVVSVVVQEASPP